MAALLGLGITVRSGSGTGRIIDHTAIAAACSIRWAPPETLRTAAGTRVRLETTDALARGAEILLVGRLAVETDTARRVIPSAGAPDGYLRGGIVIRPNGLVRILAAPHDSALLAPRIAQDDAGRVTMLWAHEGESAGSAREIWTGRLVDTAWADVTRVFEGDVHWGRPYHSMLLARNQELRLVVGRAGLDDDSGGVFLRRHDGVWRAVPLRIPAAAYVSLADLPGDTLLVAFVAGTREASNALFVQRFGIDGTPVGTRVRIDTTSAGGVYDPRMVVAHDSIVVLVWSSWTTVPEAGGALAFDRLRLARSVDGGATWQSFDGPAPRLEMPDALAATVDRRGVVFLGISALDGGIPHPLAVTFDAGRWHQSAPPRIPGSSLVGPPVIVPAGRDSLRLIWLAHGLVDPERDPGVMVWSNGVRICDDTVPDRTPQP